MTLAEVRAALGARGLVCRSEARPRVLGRHGLPRQQSPAPWRRRTARPGGTRGPPGAPVNSVLTPPGGGVLAEPGATTPLAPPAGPRAARACAGLAPPDPGTPPLASLASRGAAGAPPSGGPAPSTETPANPTSRRAAPPHCAPAPSASWTPAPAIRGPRPARAGRTPAPTSSAGLQTAPPALPSYLPAHRARPAAAKAAAHTGAGLGTASSHLSPPCSPPEGHTSVNAAGYRPTGSDAALGPVQLQLA